MLLFPILVAGCGPQAEPPRATGLHELPIGLLVAELESNRPRPRVYNFWATWCGPCLAELPALRAFGRSHPEIDLIFVNVDIPALLPTRVKQTITRMDLEAFEHLVLAEPDPSGALQRLEGWPNTIPVTMVVSKRGERVKQFNTRVDGAILARALAVLPD